MNKLPRPKKYLSLEEAAESLTNLLDETATVADILQLGLNKELTLSVNLIYEAKGRACKNNGDPDETIMEPVSLRACMS